MYIFFHDYLKAMFENRVKLLYIYGFVLHTRTSKIEEELLPDLRKWFDTSNYLGSRILKTQRQVPDCNKKVLGMFKNEMAKSERRRSM